MGSFDDVVRRAIVYRHIAFLRSKPRLPPPTPGRRASLLSCETDHGGPDPGLLRYLTRDPDTRGIRRESKARRAEQDDREQRAGARAGDAGCRAGAGPAPSCCIVPRGEPKSTPLIITPVSPCSPDELFARSSSAGRCRPQVPATTSTPLRLRPVIPRRSEARVERKDLRNAPGRGRRASPARLSETSTRRDRTSTP